MPNADFVGLRVFDVSNPDKPRDIHHWHCVGTGVHRFTFDGRYAYISAEHEGYVGTIVMILDFANPEMPEGVGRWWRGTPRYQRLEQTTDHKWMLVADEHVQPFDPKLSPELPAMLWMVDITDETNPIPVSTFQLPDLVGVASPLMTGCHQPVETIVGNEVPAAWWMPNVSSGAQRVCSNDVYVDHRGLIYLIDRNRGLSILERV
jgi:hypothetical protein